MYENKYKNSGPTWSTDLYHFLQLIADLNEELELFAIGGTAIEDCIAIIKHEKLDFKKLKQRYYLYAETAIISDYDYKFKHFELKWHQK